MRETLQGTMMQMLDAVPRRAVLCSEKDEPARAVLRKAFSEYELVFAASAFETIRSMNARAFDAYVIEYWLPDWSGPQLCRAIREVDPHCPVLFYTAAEGELSHQRAARAGGSAYLGKAVEPAELKASLTKLFAKSDAASLRAKCELEQALEQELERWQPRLAVESREKDSLQRSLERSARARAYKTFIAGGGCRAHFERWWPQLFGSARANTELAVAS
jgi:DNA-binding response OmpR family regulator